MFCSRGVYLHCFTDSNKHLSTTLQILKFKKKIFVLEHFCWQNLNDNKFSYKNQIEKILDFYHKLKHILKFT